MKNKIQKSYINIKLLIGAAIILCGVGVLIPCIIDWLNEDINLFTKGEILEYCGAYIPAMAMLLVSLITIMQTKQGLEQQEIIEIDRRKEIFPALSICLTKNKNNTYRLKIENISDNLAQNIYFFEENVFHSIKATELKERDISFKWQDDNKKDNMVRNIYISNNDFTADGLPKEIVLTYGDIDNNIISQNYKLTNEGLYDRRETEYMN